MLTEVSASGMKLIAAQEFVVGTQIVVELESHVALAEVRYSYARGSKFVIGMLKHNTVARLALTDDADWDEMFRVLTGTPEAAAVAEPERPAQMEAAAMDPKAAGNNIEPDIEIEHGIEPSAAIPMQSSGLDVAPVRGPLGREVEILTDEEAAELYAKAFPKTTQETYKSPEPARTLASKPAEPHYRIGVIVAVCVAFVLTLTAAGLALRPFLESPKASKILAALEPLGTPTVVNAARSSAALNSTAKRHVVILSHAPNWLSVCSDTNEQYKKLLGPGDTLQFYFDNRAVVRMGNSGASEISVDGKALGSIGGSGSPRVIALEPTGFQYATGLAADGSADCPAK